MKVSYSFGLIDLLHFGHISAMKTSSEDSDLNIFGLVSDEAFEAWSGAHVSNEEERAEVVKSIKYIDEVWKQETFDPVDNLRKIHSKYPDAIITLFYGNEWAILSAKKYVESIGGRVVKLDYYDKLSPQTILDTLNKDEIQEKPLRNNLISTKANTLQALKGMITKSKIEDIVVISYREFEDNKYNVLVRIRSCFGNKKIVIRSSSKREDAFEESNAGHFVSVLGVYADDEKSVEHAISEVLSSYGEIIEDDEQVLVQSQTENVIASGVVFTRDIQRNRPYYVINYDSSGSTDSVTSGKGGKTIWMSRTVSVEKVPLKWRGLMEAVWEIEDILSGTLLDIEFAITDDSVVIFQVRPLAAAYKFGRRNDEGNIKNAISIAMNKYIKQVRVGLTCFSDMAFWNPAEIIGDNPKNLDFSLYREIITKSAWNRGLVSMGYREVPKELMYRFGNKPFINLERSFESLTPIGISDSLAKKLGLYYVNKLKRDLSAHDKIEFEISYNCYDFNTQTRLNELVGEGFSAEEIFSLEDALKQLTLRTVREYKETLKNDLLDLKYLEVIRLDVQNSIKDTEDFCLLAKSIRILIDAIEKYGTPQFSRQARCAFIGKSIYQSLVDGKYISAEIGNEFWSSIDTIAVDYDRDYHLVLQGKMNEEEFRTIYGHLRAGTYNIRSPRYDQMDRLFPYDKQSKKDDIRENKYIDDIICKALDKALSNSCLEGLSGKELISFIRLATEQREYFKFVFTKSLSFVIELIKKLGTIAKVSVNDLSYLELPEIYAIEYYSDVDRLHEFWSLIIEKRREIYKYNSKIIFPAVIVSEHDFECIENIDSRPNFITENVISGEVVVLDDNTEKSIDGKIVVVEKADPGYDWIFSKGITGLVTKYGGAASHMAIRCAEFKIPAAIGCGASLFDYVLESQKLTIDCMHEKIIKEK